MRGGRIALRPLVRNGLKSGDATVDGVRAQPRIGEPRSGDAADEGVRAYLLLTGERSGESETATDGLIPQRCTGDGQSG